MTANMTIPLVSDDTLAKVEKEIEYMISASNSADAGAPSEWVPRMLIVMCNNVLAFRKMPPETDFEKGYLEAINRMMCEVSRGR